MNMNTGNRKKLVVQIVAAFGAANGFGMGVAISQTSPGATPPPKSVGLEEIVVTAQRRAEACPATRARRWFLNPARRE